MAKLRHRFHSYCSSQREKPLGLGRVASSADGCKLSASRRLLRFVNLRKSEAEPEQPVLIENRPSPCEAKTLAQPQHDLEALDGAPGRVEALEATDPRHVLLQPEVVALDSLLEVLRDVMDGVAGQQALVPRRREGGWVGAGPVRADPIGRQQGRLLQRLAEEPLGGVEIALGGEEEVDRLAVLVDGAIQVAPLTPDPDLGLIDADRTAMGLAEGTQPAFDRRRVGQHPAVHGGVIDLEATFEQHLLDVAVAQRVAQVLESVSAERNR